MKITLKDFGPISHFEFDLEKDLHVIFGKNNIGKSYAITAVYLILKHCMDGIHHSMNDVNKFFYDENSPRMPWSKNYNTELSNAEKKIKDNIDNKNTANNDIIIESLFGSLITNLFVKKLENSLKNSFNSIDKLSNEISKNKLQIEIQCENYIFTISSNKNELELINVKLKRPVIASIDKNGKDILYSCQFLDSVKKENTNLPLLLFFLYLDFTFEVVSFIDNVYFLPSSRSGLYNALSTFSTILVELSKSRNFLTNKVELPNISEPVSDYFLNLSNISKESILINENLIEYFENEILHGSVLFNQDNKKLFFRQSGMNFDLDLSFTSSMVSELAPIVAYLKYIIGAEKRNISSENTNAKYGLLFIEEPEAHLHPEVQVKLMEMFALLAGKNIKIVMTSHSNYMFNKLSNLVLDGAIDYNKVDSYLMRATDRGSVTDMLSMKAETDGMNDENFADVAEMLYEERIKIYEKLNKKAENVD